MANNTNQGGGAEKRGFASMDTNKQREIASMGGKAAHANGNAHEWSSEEAREAGRAGGKATHKSTSASEDMSEQIDTQDNLSSDKNELL